MTIDEQCRIIADNNEVILASIVKMMVDKFKVNTDTLINSTNNIIKQYISFLLLRVYSDNYKLLEYRNEIDTNGKLLQEYINTMVQGDNMNVSEQGRSTGGKKGKPDDAAIKLIELKEKQRIRIQEYDEVSERVKSEHEIIKKFLELLPQAHYARVMIAFYFESKRDAEIEREMNFAPSVVRKIKLRSMQELVKLIRKHLVK